MPSTITVDRTPTGGAHVVFTDSQGFIAEEYLTPAQVVELISKLTGIWREPQDTAQAFAEERTRIGNTPTDEDEEEEEDGTCHRCVLPSTGALCSDCLDRR